MNHGFGDIQPRYTYETPERVELGMSRPKNTEGKGTIALQATRQHGVVLGPSVGSWPPLDPLALPAGKDVLASQVANLHDRGVTNLVQQQQFIDRNC